MGKGSTVTSSRPTFRSGTIRTPADPRVTERKGTPNVFVAPDHLIGLRTVDERNIKVGRRESLGIETANATPAAPVWYAETRDGMHVEVNAGNVRRVRTVADGDDTLTPYRVPVEAAPVKAPRAVKAPRTVKPARKATPAQAGRLPVDEAAAAERKAARAAQDKAITAYLRTIGYKGPLTAKVRELALDALAFAATIAEYEAAR